MQQQSTKSLAQDLEAQSLQEPAVKSKRKRCKPREESGFASFSLTPQLNASTAKAGMSQPQGKSGGLRQMIAQVVENIGWEQSLEEREQIGLQQTKPGSIMESTAKNSQPVSPRCGRIAQSCIYMQQAQPPSHNQILLAQAGQQAHRNLDTVRRRTDQESLTAAAEVLLESQLGQRQKMQSQKSIINSQESILQRKLTNEGQNLRSYQFRERDKLKSNRQLSIEKKTNLRGKPADRPQSQKKSLRGKESPGQFSPSKSREESTIHKEKPKSSYRYQSYQQKSPRQSQPKQLQTIQKVSQRVPQVRLQSQQRKNGFRESVWDASKGGKTSPEEQRTLKYQKKANSNYFKQKVPFRGVQVVQHNNPQLQRQRACQTDFCMFRCQACKLDFPSLTFNETLCYNCLNDNQRTLDSCLYCRQDRQERRKQSPSRYSPRPVSRSPLLMPGERSYGFRQPVRRAGAGWQSPSRVKHLQRLRGFR